MAVNLSPVGGVAAQFFDNNGNVLTGGKLYTYLAGTTTPAVAYTSSLGVTAQPNPIVLNAAGRVPGSGEIWLTDGIIYKFVLETSNNVLIATYDNITGINSNFVNFTAEQEIQTATAGQTVFNLATMQYQVGTNSLSVFVDGVNQYGPGAQFAYLETDSDTVTFVSGLHVGASVKFTTTTQTTGNATNASVVAFTGFNGQTGTVQDLADDDGSDWIGFDQAGTGAVARSAQDKMRDVISIADFGASPSASASVNRAAIQAAIDSIPDATGGTVVFPKGVFDVDGTIDSNNRQGLVIDGCGATINLTTSVSYLFTITDVAVEVRNLFVNKGVGVVASAFNVTGIRHVFNNVQSGDQKWTRFFHLVDVKESFFTNLNVYLDTATQTGTVFYLDYSVNNTFSDSFIGFCEHGVFASSTSQPTSGYKSEGWLMSNVIIVYPQKAMTIDAGTLFSVVNCCFDFCEIWGIFQSNGNNLKIMNNWIASNTTNGFIGVGTTNTVFGVSVIGNVFVRGAAAITGTAGVSLSGPNALVIGNAFQSGMNGGVVTDTGSQVIGNSVSSPGTNIVANNTVSTVLGAMSIETGLTVAGSQGIFPTAVSGSATAGANGATPAQVAGYATVNIGGTDFKVPYYNA